MAIRPRPSRPPGSPARARAGGAAVSCATALCAAALGACSSPGTRAPEPEREATPRAPDREGTGTEDRDARFVVVAGNARLLIAPRADADGFELSPAEGWDPREAHRFAGHVFRAAGESGSFVALETISLADAPLHCPRVTRGLGPFQLRLYVDRAAVREIVVEPFRAEDAAGLRVQVFPGQVLDDALLDLLDRTCGDCRTRLALGREYRPGAWRDPERTDLVLCDDGSLRARCSGSPVHGVRDLADGVAATLRRGCHLYEVKARMGADGGEPLQAIGGVAASGLLGRDEEPAAPARPIVRAGAPATWRDGTPAGSVRADHELDEETAPAGGRRCFRHVVTCVARSFAAGDCERTSSLELCFDPSHIAAPGRDGG